MQLMFRHSSGTLLLPHGKIDCQLINTILGGPFGHCSWYLVPQWLRIENWRWVVRNFPVRFVDRLALT